MTGRLTSGTVTRGWWVCSIRSASRGVCRRKHDGASGFSLDHLGSCRCLGQCQPFDHPATGLSPGVTGLRPADGARYHLPQPPGDRRHLRTRRDGRNSSRLHRLREGQRLTATGADRRRRDQVGGLFPQHPVDQLSLLPLHGAGCGPGRERDQRSGRRDPAQRWFHQGGARGCRRCGTEASGRRRQRNTQGRRRPVHGSDGTGHCLRKLSPARRHL